ncbi:MAG: hypothetical protein ACYTE8_09820 [Planctomycetota bacterium]
MPVISNKVSAETLTPHNVVIRAYEIPKGIFRGAIQPLNRNGYFAIWNIENKQEVYYDIPSPRGFLGTEKIVTDEWSIHLLEQKEDMEVYQAARKNEAVSLKFQVPFRKRAYTFYVLRNDKDQEMIVFADLSEFWIDRGVFGYIVICKDSDATCNTKAADELHIKRTLIH